MIGGRDRICNWNPNRDQDLEHREIDRQIDSWKRIDRGD